MSRADKHCATCHMREDGHDGYSPDHAFVVAFDTRSEFTIFCPWCGEENSTDDVASSCEFECGSCEREFSVEIEYDPSYTTMKIECFGCRADIEHPRTHSAFGYTCGPACAAACELAYAEYRNGAIYPKRGFAKESK